MEHQEERICPNLQSLQRVCPLPLGSACMTEYLIAVRAAIILWTSLAVIPAEIVFDAIEAELERRRVESQTLLSEAIRCASCLERHCYPSETTPDA
jgi:hypothetical protein